MRVGIANDNSRKLSLWKEVLPEAEGFYSNISYLFLEKLKNPDLYYDILILDRVFYENDILEDSTIPDLKVSFPNTILILSSALHVEGEEVSSFDLVIDHMPTSLCSILDLLKRGEA